MASKWVELQSAEDVLALEDSVWMFHKDSLYAPYRHFQTAQEWWQSDWFSTDRANGWTYRVLVEEDVSPTEDDSPTSEEDTDEE